jgi:hypothetical protein
MGGGNEASLNLLTHEVGPQSLHDGLADLVLLTFALHRQRRRIARVGQSFPYANIYTVIVAPRPELDRIAMLVEVLGDESFELASVPTFPWRRETPGYASIRSTYWNL